MDEIDVREQKCISDYIPFGKKLTVAGICSSSIGLFTDCKVWQSWKFIGNKTIKVMNFFGTESDVEMAKYLYNVIDEASKTEAANFKNTVTYAAASGKRSATVSFGHGMSHRIGYRLTQLKKENDAALRAAHGLRMQQAQSHVDLTPREKTAAEAVAPGSTVTGTALIVLKKQIVEHEYNQLGMKLRSYSTTRRIRDGNAYSKGTAAGDRVNLSRPISGNKTSGYLS